MAVRYSKSLTVGVKKKKIIPLCHVAHELTNRTYGEKKWWVVIVKDQSLRASVRERPFVLGLARGRQPASF